MRKLSKILCLALCFVCLGAIFVGCDLGGNKKNEPLYTKNIVYQSTTAIEQDGYSEFIAISFVTDSIFTMGSIPSYKLQPGDNIIDSADKGLSAEDLYIGLASPLNKPEKSFTNCLCSTYEFNNLEILGTIHLNGTAGDIVITCKNFTENGFTMIYMGQGKTLSFDMVKVFPVD